MSPPTPPKGSAPLSPPTTSHSGRKSPSFSSLLRPASIKSSDDKPTSSDSGSAEKEGKLSAKVKEFFGKDKRHASTSSLASSAKVSSGSTVSASSTSTVQPAKPRTTAPPDSTDSSGTTDPAPSNALQVAITGNDSFFRISSSTRKPLSQTDRSAADDFKAAMEAAEKSVARMQTATYWMGIAASGLSAGGVWLPMVGHGVQAVVTMLETAKEVGVAKVAAMRLVERCANIIEAVSRKLEPQRHNISLDMRQDVNRLLTDIHKTAFLLSKLAARPFFKQWLHAGEIQDQIAEATTDIDAFFSLFHVSAALTTNAMLEQARTDREADQAILRDMIQAGIQDENVLLTMLVKKGVFSTGQLRATADTLADEQQEAIKTLQRALDNLRYEQGHSPQGSPDFSPTRHVMESPASLTIGLPTVYPLYLPDNTGHSPATRQSTSTSHSSGLTDTSHLSVQAQAGGSLPEGVLSTADEMGTQMRKTASDEGPQTITAASRSATRPLSVQKTDPRRVFIEKALDVLRRHSATADYGVPEWTITSLEITHEIRLATSFFSTIWKGKWQGERVAIKELHKSIDRSLFITEVEVWRRLRSKHVLPFFGASSTTGPPPWFMVSPYMRNGNVLNYVRKASWTPAERCDRVLGLVLEMAEAMEYLHSREIRHGDFKVSKASIWLIQAANVLVSDIGEALICDFGLSKLKSDLTCRSEDDPEADRSARGTMRWQSPQRLLGGPLTAACDVYAFAITVCELYGAETGEATPFGYADDAVVRKRVIDGDRPNRPDHLPDSLWKLIEKCWTHDPAGRPTFETIVRELTAIIAAKSTRTGGGSPSTSTGTFETAAESLHEEQHVISPQLANRPLPSEDGGSSSSGSIRSIPLHLAKEVSFESDRAERHYRHYLNHDFDDRLSVPLWLPSEVELGSVGYMRHGQFVKLLDAIHPPPEATELPPVPRLDEFAALSTHTTPVNVHGVADKGWDMVHSAWMNFIKSSGEKSQKSISRQYSFPLKPGGKQAVLVVDDAQCEIYRSFSEARSYLTANIDWILKYHADSHHIVKEDVIIVVGTLSANNYAMAVSQFAPRTTLMFNVHSESQRKAGEPWGTWTVNRQQGNEEPAVQFICKVSAVSSSPRDAVLLAKLKFPPGGGEPALYP